MAVEWYCRIKGEEIGPVTSEQLKSMADSAEITPNTQLRRADSGNWVRAEQVARLFSHSTSTANKESTNQTDSVRHSVANSAPAKRAIKPAVSAQARAVTPLPAKSRPPVINPSPTSEAEMQFAQSPLKHRRTKKSSAGTVFTAVGGAAAIALVAGFAVVNGGGTSEDKKPVAETKQKEKEKEQEVEKPKPAEANPPPTLAKAFEQIRSYMKNGANLASRNLLIVPKEIAIAPASPNPNSPVYLIVRLELLNTSPTNDLIYTSWNEAEQKPQSAAFARDDRGREARLVPASSTPELTRLRTVVLKPNTKQSDILVFRLSSAELDGVQLALSIAAVGGNGYVGLELPRKNMLLLADARQFPAESKPDPRRTDPAPDETGEPPAFSPLPANKTHGVPTDDPAVAGPDPFPLPAPATPQAEAEDLDEANKKLLKAIEKSDGEPLPTSPAPAPAP